MPSLEEGEVTEEQAAQALARLRTSTDRAAIAGADIVIDAAFEDVDLKRELFRDFERHASPPRSSPRTPRRSRS